MILYLCWAKSMSILVTLRWWVESFWAALFLLSQRALNCARRAPRAKRVHPTPMSAVEYCAASAPGASCTSPTMRTTTPKRIEPTTTCRAFICKFKWKWSCYYYCTLCIRSMDLFSHIHIHIFSLHCQLSCITYSATMSVYI